MAVIAVRLHGQYGGYVLAYRLPYSDRVNRPQFESRFRFPSCELKLASVVHRFGAERTRVTDIARAIGLSHSALYRHFPSRSDMFAGVVQEMMDDEAEIAHQLVGKPQPAAQRLRGMILDLHRRKRAHFLDDAAVHGLHRFVAGQHASALVVDYARRMTQIIADIIGEGLASKEFAVSDVARMAGAVRDAITPFVYPAVLETMAGDTADAEARLNNVIDLIVAGLRRGARPIAPIVERDRSVAPLFRDRSSSSIQ